MSRRLQRIAQRLRLRFLPALVQPFKGNQRSAHGHSSAKHVVDRLAAPDDAPRAALDERFRRQEPPVVIERHRRAVRTGIEHREQVADRRAAASGDRSRAIARFAKRADDIDRNLVARDSLTARIRWNAP